MKAIFIILILAIIAIYMAIAFALIIHLLTRDRFYDELDEQVDRAHRGYFEETKKR